MGNCWKKKDNSYFYLGIPKKNQIIKKSYSFFSKKYKAQVYLIPSDKDNNNYHYDETIFHDVEL